MRSEDEERGMWNGMWNMERGTWNVWNVECGMCRMCRMWMRKYEWWECEMKDVFLAEDIKRGWM